MLTRPMQGFRQLRAYEQNILSLSARSSMIQHSSKAIPASQPPPAAPSHQRQRRPQTGARTPVSRTPRSAAIMSVVHASLTQLDRRHVGGNGD